MEKITLIIEAKRFRGESESGKSLNFVTSFNGGTFFSIPKSSIIAKREFKKKYGSSTLDMMEIYFHDWATQYGEQGRVLDDVLNRLIHEPCEVIRNVNK